MPNEKILKSRKLCQEVKELASKYNLEFFFITEGASCCNIKTNEAVRHARKEHEKWEIKNGFNPEEDWSNSNFNNF